jgi:hypothetical protein
MSIFVELRMQYLGSCHLGNLSLQLRVNLPALDLEFE